MSRTLEFDVLLPLFLLLPWCNRNKQFVRDRPAMTEMCVQLKWNWMIGVWPLGAEDVPDLRLPEIDAV